MIILVQQKICVVTGSRAEYGLLKPLLRKLQEAEPLQFQLIVTGSHLSKQHGNTVEEIVNDGFTIDRKINMDLKQTEPESLARSLAEETTGLAEAFRNLRPDLILILGDRYELLPVGQVATLFNIPLGHIHGGETTLGAIDELIRHSLTKLSSLHFPAAQPYAKRIIQMGEQPERVYNVGALALDNIRALEEPNPKTVKSRLQLEPDQPFFLVTYHPATRAEEPPRSTTKNLLKALKSFDRHQVLFTQPNADEGSRAIREEIESFVQTYNWAHFIEHLGSELYLQALMTADVVIGNSSSGIIEAPFVGIPTVNIGSRQQGRLKSNSIIDVSTKSQALIEAIEQALSPEFQRNTQQADSKYGEGTASDSIVKALNQWGSQDLVPKSFYDIKFTLDNNPS